MKDSVPKRRFFVTPKRTGTSNQATHSVPITRRFHNCNEPELILYKYNISFSLDYGHGAQLDRGSDETHD